jgi:hypothetical protein
MVKVVLAKLSEIDLTSYAGASRADIKLGPVYNLAYGFQAGGTEH